ncbi:hypothetical protein Bpfe_012882 [Biomphalaria pfeifferi]|uniref:Uncharacterized protein n=1 Tax=Biomphalaria pfeifferi TaxID=112525 RepID=A0AAD8BPK3_BIOPF|nr:hypothetical protein Bpfe_012882 [Biomphalaria pfeifferi]
MATVRHKNGNCQTENMATVRQKTWQRSYTQHCHVQQKTWPLSYRQHGHCPIESMVAVYGLETTVDWKRALGNLELDMRHHADWVKTLVMEMS